MPQFYIRLGALGEIHLAESTHHPKRGSRVIVRTPRGVELAEIVGAGPVKRSPESETRRDVVASHRVLRETTEQDELLMRRLERHKRTAIENCRRELSLAESSATLLDVDQLFDGGTLIMHFLGPVDEVAESITERIVGEYESVVRSRHLAKLLHDGCGPECGQTEGGGCGTGGCASCAVAAGCCPTEQP